jgi:hypothetical protein
MKTFNLLILITLFAKISFAQIGINTTGASANSSAMLDVSSTSKGLLIPRMSTSQRTGIGSPAKGLMVFDNDTNGFWYYNGSSWSNIAGSGGLTLPFSQTITSGSNAFDISNLGNGAAIKGNSTTANSSAIYGETSNGTGVKGYSNNAGSVAVFGSSLQGTGVKAYSLSGTALDVIGNLKISGGNTSPSNGAVLTSDATGNAVWKNSRIAFSVSGLNSNLVSLPANSTRVVHLLTEEFDYGNNYVLNTTNSPSFGNSVFVAPVAGLYHFDASVPIRTSDISSDENIRFSELRLKITRVGSPIIYADISEFSQGINTAVFLGQASISKDVHLLKNDIVELEIKNGSDFAYVINDYSDTKSHFGCHLIFAD